MSISEMKPRSCWYRNIEMLSVPSSGVGPSVSNWLEELTPAVTPLYQEDTHHHLTTTVVGKHKSNRSRAFIIRAQYPAHLFIYLSFKAPVEWWIIIESLYLYLKDWIGSTNTDYIGAKLQVDDVDIFNRFILRFKSSSTMWLHFTQMYLLSACLSSPV